MTSTEYMRAAREGHLCQMAEAADVPVTAMFVAWTELHCVGSLVTAYGGFGTWRQLVSA